MPALRTKGRHSSAPKGPHTPSRGQRPGKTIRQVTIGDQIRPGTYPFHSAFNRVVNFEHNGRLISVVTEETGPGPLNIVIRPNQVPSFSAAPHPPPLKITAKTVLFANRRFRFTARHRYCSSFDFKSHHPRRLRRNLETFGKFLKRSAPPRSLAFLLDETRLKNFRSASERAFVRQIRLGVHQLFHGRPVEGVRLIKGCGSGLTPSGDDFLAGMLIGLRFLQTPKGRSFQSLADDVFNAARGDNIFSNTFLDLARQGLLLARVKRLLTALLKGSQQSVRTATGLLLAIGANSGADLATGFFLTVYPKSRPDRSRGRCLGGQAFPRNTLEQMQSRRKLARVMERYFYSPEPH